MTYCSLIDILSAGLGLIGGSFFCWGSVTITRKQANLLAGACASGNPHVAAFFRVLKIDYLAGAIFLILAFIVQVAAKFQPFSCEIYQASHYDLMALAIGIFVIGLVAWIVKIRLETKIKKELGV